MPIIYHVYSWIAFYLIFAILVFTPLNQNKIVKILFRLSQVSVIVTGVIVSLSIFEYEPATSTIKILLSIAIFGLMDMVLARKRRGEGFLLHLIGFVIVSAVVIYLGYSIS